MIADVVFASVCVVVLVGLGALFVGLFGWLLGLAALVILLSMIGFLGRDAW